MRRFVAILVFTGLLVVLRTAPAQAEEPCTGGYVAFCPALQILPGLITIGPIDCFGVLPGACQR